MLDIIKIILPIFITILIGYLIAYFQMLNKDQFKIIGLFIIKVSIPCLLIVSISSQDFHTLIQAPYLISYGSASFIVFLTTLIMYFKVFAMPLNASSVMAMSSSMSNTGFIGSGLLYLLIGERAAIYFGMTFLIENFVVFLMFLICLEFSKTRAPIQDILKNSIINVLKNPIVIALLLGSSMSLCSLQLPELLLNVIKPIGQTSMPLGLLVIGGSLYGITLMAQKSLGRDIAITLGLKLIILPTLVYSIFHLFPSATAEMIFAGTLLASVSMVGMSAVYAQQYDMKKVPFILLMSTLCSIISLTTVIHFLHGSV